jgi:hypothetical protein
MLTFSDIDRFFIELDKEFDRPLNILITGAVAGAMMGNVRPSDDIDFEIQLPDGSRKDQSEKLELSINAVAQRLQIPPQYTENIGGWSQITLLDYRQKALPYKKIGQIQINFLSPEHWSIGKLARYLPLDRKDLIQVLKNKKTNSKDLIKILSQALKKSPLSDKSREFKDHVIDFLENEGPKIWGHKFSATAAIEDFKHQAGIK